MTMMEKAEVAQLLNENPHLKGYLETIRHKIGNPVFYSKVPREVRDESYPNLIYPTKGVVFIHIYRTKDMDELEYHVIEPIVDDVIQEKLDVILKLIVKKAPEKKSVITDGEMKEVLKELIDEITIIDERAIKLQAAKKKGKMTKQEKVKVTSFQKSVLQYFIIKTLVGGGPLEAFMRDPYLEDIHFVANEKIHLIHKIFGMIKTNVLVGEKEAPAFTRSISEKMGSPVSEGRPIVDGVLPDGSRGNIIYSSAVSIKGPSMTIRRFTETPISVTQLIKWGTINSSIAAYLWLCLQYGRSFFLCGGTACGKTTTMNSIIPFVPPEKKIFTAEGTPELQVPHTVWQRLLTKTTGPKEGQVDLFDLLKAALRSRPDYIIPGEVRGAEGNIVFQAMQTGHPCMTTFHAGSITQVIQRFTGDPINVPKTFMDNLDFVVIQLAIERNGRMIRRCTAIDEIEGYNREVDGIMSRKAFEWKADEDVHVFKANRNSFVLEEKIAKNAGYFDTAQIYDEHERRKHILDRMVEEDIMDYYEVVQCIWGFYREGEKGLPITV
ncbi:MAG: type II/IV secretion system ATPase subunit [Thermoplasmata archaeon]|nr:type II/IV secretion system ATPase subunit [Thermoplasmata archaeon]MBE3136107.1 type II/IV secretion system ATPase subunit [Thermoplasmata archaeon]